MKKFLLIDDHSIIRSGVSKLLSEIFMPCEVHEACDGESAGEWLKKNNYDLVIMDIQMPNTETLSLLEYILFKDIQGKVLIFSMSSENIYAKRFLNAGAKGFISKIAPLEELKKAIQLILSGRKYISESLTQSIAEKTFSPDKVNPFDTLSEREFQIVNLLLTGQTVKEIANSLNLHSSTIGTHKARIFEKLHVANTIELKEMASSHKL